MKLIASALLVSSIAFPLFASAATPTACGYDYWPEADFYRTIKETPSDISGCQGQLLDDQGECVDLQGDAAECRLDV